MATDYEYDRADRVRRAGGLSYTVDADGNTTNRGTDTFGYDQANRLVRAGAGATGTYSYDGDGKRMRRQVGNQDVRHVYDVAAGLPVLLEDDKRKYVRGLGLGHAAEGDNIEVYHADGLGSVRAVTDNAGRVTKTYETDEFGIPTLFGRLGSQPFGFTGEQRDAETGFSYLRARMHDPLLGRFLQRDPDAGVGSSRLTLNRYSYVENNPVNRTHPSGLAPRAKGERPNDGRKWKFEDGKWKLDKDGNSKEKKRRKACSNPGQYTASSPGGPPNREYAGDRREERRQSRAPAPSPNDIERGLVACVFGFFCPVFIPAPTMPAPSIEEEESRRRWTCIATRNIEGTQPKCWGQRAVGTGSGKTQEDAQDAAYAAAEANMKAKVGTDRSGKAGCYIRHCSYKCSQ